MARIKAFCIRNRKLLITWAVILLTIFLGLHFHLDKKVMTFGIVVFGIFTQAFSGLLAIIGLTPIIGAPIVHIISLPFIWIINGLAYIFTLGLIRKGHKIDIFKSRILVTSFLIGIVIGFVVGKLL